MPTHNEIIRAALAEALAEKPDAGGARALQERERLAFQWITDKPGKSAALMAVTFDGEPTACVVHVTEEPDHIEIRPIMLVLTTRMLDRLRDPNGVAPTLRPTDSGSMH